MNASDKEKVLEFLANLDEEKDDISIPELLNLLDTLRRENEIKTRAIEEYNNSMESFKREKPQKFETVNESVIENETAVDEIGKSAFLCSTKIKNLELVDSKHILEQLPKKDDYNFEIIVKRVIAEITRDISDIDIYISQDIDLLDKEDLKELRDLALSYDNKREIVKELLYASQDEIEEDDKGDNTLIFVPIKGSDKIRVFEDLKSIPVEEYEKFIELFESIKNGTFKNKRRFYNNSSLDGALEVKGKQVRVVYKRLDKNKYAIITMFMKKTQNSNGYRSALKTRYSEYKELESSLKEKCNDVNFILKNEELYGELMSKLSNDRSKEIGGK